MATRARQSAKTSNFSIESSELELETTNHNESTGGGGGGDRGASMPLNANKPSSASLDDYFSVRNPAKKRNEYGARNSPFKYYGN